MNIPSSSFWHDYNQLAEFSKIFLNDEHSHNAKDAATPTQELLLVGEDIATLFPNTEKFYGIDLGTSRGLVVATFNLHGYKMDGVERDDSLVEAAKVRLNQVGLLDIVIDQLDYYETPMNEWKVREDPKNADLFYAHCYNKNHALAIMASTLMGNNQARIGAKLYVDTLTRHNMQDAKEFGFRPIDFQAKSGEHHWFEKVEHVGAISTSYLEILQGKRGK